MRVNGGGKGRDEGGEEGKEGGQRGKRTRGGGGMGARKGEKREREGGPELGKWGGKMCWALHVRHRVVGDHIPREVLVPRA